MKTVKIGALVSFGMLAVFAGLASPAWAVAGAVTGVGFATFAGCPPGSDLILPIAGAQAAGTWTFTAGDSNTGALGCAIASAGVFVGGGYSVAGGGCLPGVFAGEVLCLGGFAEPGPATVGLFMCQLVAGCVVGSATLVGADA